MAVRLLQAFIASRHPSAHKLHLLHKKGKEKEKNKNKNKAVRYFPALDALGCVSGIGPPPPHHIRSNRWVGGSRMHFPHRLQGCGRPRRRGGDSSSSSSDDDDSSGSSDSDGSSNGDSDDDESSSDDDSGSEGGKQHRRRRRQKRKRKRGAASSPSSGEEEEGASSSSSSSYGSDEGEEEEDDDASASASLPLSPALTGAIEGFPFDAAADDDGNDGHSGVPRLLAAYLRRARRLPRGDVRGGFDVEGVVCGWVFVCGLQGGGG